MHSAGEEELTPVQPTSSTGMSRDTKISFKYLVEVGAGHWNMRGSLSVAGGLLDIGCHTSLLRLKNGKFLVLDTIDLTPEMKYEIDLLTEHGTLIEACIATHPFHTLFFESFHRLYPKAKLVGTPRHVKKFPALQWDGGSIDTRLDEWKDLGVQMRIPAGAEFAQPADGNHFSCVFVFHEQSKTVFCDDTLMYFDPSCFSGRCLCCCMPCIGGTLKMHPTTFDGDVSSGLVPMPESVDQFLAWAQGLIADWDFDNLVTAHTGNKIGGAKNMLRELLASSSEPFAKLKRSFQDLQRKR